MEVEEKKTRCTNCSLCTQNIKHVLLEGTGNTSGRVLIVGGSPSKLDDNTGKPFSGSNGTYLHSLLSAAGLDKRDIFFTYARKCYQVAENKPEAKKALKSCNSWLQNEISVIKPKIIITFGAEAFEAVSGLSKIEKHLGTLREYEFKDHKALVMPLYGVYYISNQGVRVHNDTINYLKRAVSSLNGSLNVWKPEKIDKLNYTYIRTIDQVKHLVKRIEEEEVFALDIESRGLSPFNVYSTSMPLVSLQFSVAHGEAYFLPWAHSSYREFIGEDEETKEKLYNNKDGIVWTKEERNQIIELLRPALEDKNDTYTLIGHNFKFDYKWIRKYLDINCKLDYDTMLAASLKGEAQLSLKKLVWECTDLGGYEDEKDKILAEVSEEERWDLFFTPIDVLFRYGCIDADATLRIFKSFIAREVINDSNREIFEILINASRSFAAIEFEGFKLDREYIKQLDVILTADMGTIAENFRLAHAKDIAKVEEELIQKAKGKSGNLLKGKPITFSLASNDHVSSLLYEHKNITPNQEFFSKKTNKPSTSRPALKDLSAKYPFVNDIISWRMLAKQKSSFVDAYPNFMDEKDRVHPEYNLVQYLDDSGDEIGTVTGRLSCIEENQYVTMSDGLKKKIKDVKVGETVQSYDKDTLVFSKVLAVIDKGEQECIKLHWSLHEKDKSTQGSITCTPDHRLYLKNHSWKEAGKIGIKKTALFNVFSGKECDLYIFKRENVGKKKVYDLTIERTENFVVGDLVVHNCSNPNVQQVPSRGDGKKIKKIFIPDDPSHVIGDCDYSGIELRVAAMYCGDPKMRDFFNSGKGDFHSLTAAEIFGKSTSDITDEERSYAKTTNFCLPLDAEILTLNGYKKYNEIKYGDTVMAYDPISDGITTAVVTGVETFDNQPLVRMKSEGFSTLSTPEHRWVSCKPSYNNRKSYLAFPKKDLTAFKTTHELEKGDRILLSSPATLESSFNLDDGDSYILGILLTYISDNNITLHDYITKHSFILNNKAYFKIDLPYRVKKNSSSFHHFKRFFPATRPEISHSVSSHDKAVYLTCESDYILNLFDCCDLSISSFNWVSFITKLSAQERTWFLRGMFIVKFNDSTVRPSSLSFHKNASDSLILAMFLQGYFVSSIKTRKRENTGAYQVYYGNYPLFYLEKELERHDKVWCVQTSIGTWIAKYNGQVFITGNCILYGGGPSKVAKLINVKEENARRFILEYFKIFPNLRRWLDDQKRFVQQNKYVVSNFGRKRYLPDVDSSDEYLRERAYRQACNTVIQADASDLTLLAVGKIYYYLQDFPHKNLLLPSSLKASVHDSIILSVLTEDAPEILTTIKYEILEKSGVDFVERSGVRLRADVSIGPSWGEQTDLEFEE